MRYTVLTLIIFIISSLAVRGQEKKYFLTEYKIIDNDTVPYIKISGVEIYNFKIFKNKRLARQNTRLIRNVKAVYPWAKLAGLKLHEYETVLLEAKTKKQQRQIMKQVEKEIHEQYGGELKKLTISQGKILIKLIDRETGNTS